MEGLTGMTTFDISKLTSATTKVEGSITLPQPDEGEYRAIIDTNIPLESWFREVEVTNKETGNKEPRLILRVPFLIQDDAVASKLSRDRVVVSQDLWLDLLPDGSPDLETEGRNMRLHRLRAAVGQNNKGKSWSIAALPGAGPLMVHITKRENPRGGDPFTEVDRVAPLS